MVVLEVKLTVVPPWRHVILFAGLRSAISDETLIKKKTTKALEDAYIRAFSGAIGQANREVSRDVAEGTLHFCGLYSSDVIFPRFDGTSQLDCSGTFNIICDSGCVTAIPD
jgi:hypothetical protein